MFCEQCGLQLLPRQSVCSRCGVAATRHWLQVVSLAGVAVAAACNSLVAQRLLPRLVEGDQASVVFRAWLWFSEMLSFFGWLPLALAVLAWAYWPRGEGYEPPWEVRLARFLLIVLLLAGLAALAVTGVPVDATAGLRSTLQDHPGLAPTLAWGMLVLAVGIVCLNAETRDSLLGDGRILSLVGLGLLLALLGLMALGWTAT